MRRDIGNIGRKKALSLFFILNYLERKGKHGGNGV